MTLTNQDFILVDPDYYQAFQEVMEEQKRQVAIKALSNTEWLKLGLANKRKLVRPHAK